ncbi:hypothetical protein ACLBW2_18335 [Enterobacteriaceae bacterium C23F]
MKKLLILLCAFQLTACAVSLDKIEHSSFETIVYPVNIQTTLLCLNTASKTNHFRFDESETLPGGERRFTLSRRPDKPLINLDMREHHGKTHIDYVIDRREKKRASDLDAVLAECKDRLNQSPVAIG